MLGIGFAARKGDAVVQDRGLSVLDAPKLEADAVSDGRVGAPDDKGIVAVGIDVNLQGHGSAPLVLTFWIRDEVCTTL
jgi:hypothetical protein